MNTLLHKMRKKGLPYLGSLQKIFSSCSSILVRLSKKLGMEKPLNCFATFLAVLIACFLLSLLPITAINSRFLISSPTKPVHLSARSPLFGRNFLHCLGLFKITPPFWSWLLVPHFSGNTSGFSRLSSFILLGYRIGRMGLTGYSVRLLCFSYARVWLSILPVCVSFFP